MNYLTVSYPLIYRFKDHHHLQVSKCKRICNTKTGRQIKITTNGGSIGIWIGNKFIIKSELNNHIEKIPKKEYCPF